MGKKFLRTGDRVEHCINAIRYSRIAEAPPLCRKQAGDHRVSKPLSQQPGGYARNDRIRLDIAGHHCVRTDDSTVADLDTGKYYRAVTDPDIVADIRTWSGLEVFVYCRMGRKLIDGMTGRADRTATPDRTETPDPDIAEQTVVSVAPVTDDNRRDQRTTRKLDKVFGGKAV